MTWIYSPDGTTVVKTVRTLPDRMVRRLDTGEWSIVEPSTADQFGYWPLQEVARPDADHVRTITNTGPGLFVETWMFDQARADANAAEVQSEADRSNVRALLPDLATLAQPGAMTNAEQTEAIHKLARAVRRLVFDTLG